MVGAVLVVLLAGLALISRPQPLEGTIYIQNAQLTGMNTAQSAIKNIALPHVWDDEKPALSGTASYTLSLPQEASLAVQPGQALALLIPRVGARFRVWLGDQMIHSEHWDTAGYVDTSVVPYLIALPPASLKTPLASNQIRIEVQGQLLRKSGLSAVWLGPAAVLQDRYAKVMLWQVQASWMVAACSVLVALICGLMWLQNHEKLFGLLAAASAAWALRLALTPLVHPPMAFELWFFFHKLSFTLYCGLVYLFLWETFEFKQHLARKLVISFMCIAPFWLALTTWSEIYNLYRIWTGILTGISVATLLHMFNRARWGLDANQRLMIVVGIATMVTGVRDFAVVQLGMPGDADLRWMTLGSLIFMLTLAWVLVQRVGLYMRQVNQANLALEQRVSEKESELRQAFDSLRDAERRQVLEAERARLTRDMHDGLGSQLVQTLNLVRAQGGSLSPVSPDQLAAMLSHALEELRMTLDSLEPLEGDLPAILGTLRQRIAPTLAAAGIELDWQVQEVPPVLVNGLPMESHAVMHLFRALQEIFANIVKHAQAKHVVVKTWHDTSHVYLGVQDDGVGLGQGAREGGRGMDNLRARAAALGAVLRMDGSHGTLVELRFEYDHRSDAINK